MSCTFAYRAPATRAELLSLLADHGGAAKLLAGGTDLLVDIRDGRSRPELLVNLKKVAGFAGIAWSEDEGLIISPTATISEVLGNARIRDSYPLLAACAQDFASHQIRNRATVIGNVTTASPSSDMSPGLLCLDAHVQIASQRGERTLPLREFFTGVKRTALAPDEMVEAIIVPAESAGARGGYRKLKRINGHDLAVVSVAIARHDGAMRLGIGASAPTPVLVDGLTTADGPDDVAAAVHRAISPISDVRCSREYRAYMAEVFARRLVEEVRS